MADKLVFYHNEPRPAFQKHVDRCAQRPACQRTNG